jgi:hypothetical protein
LNVICRHLHHLPPRAFVLYKWISKSYTTWANKQSHVSTPTHHSNQTMLLCW